jgi:hypothetical protein
MVWRNPGQFGLASWGESPQAAECNSRAMQAICLLSKENFASTGCELAHPRRSVSHSRQIIS